MAKVVIFGCGRGADTAYRYLSRDTAYEICAFTVDAAVSVVADEVFSERDVLTRVVAEGRDPSDTPVGVVMTKDIVVADPQENVDEAVRKMVARDFDLP